MARPSAIGLDVGGTKVAGMLVDDQGAILARDERRTPAQDVQATIDTIQEVASKLAAEGSPVAVGVGAAGMVDFRAGRIRYAPNLAWREVPVRDLVSERSGLPCLVDNDANAAAWAEYRFGAARGHDHALLVTVGTGIGGAIIAGGELYRGAHGFAGEIGHVIVEPGGPRCGCGNLGCLEQVASGQAIERLGRQAARRDPGTLVARLAGETEVTGKTVSEAARRGDEVAVGILAEVGSRLGEGIAGFVNTLDPEVVVVGGGVAEEGALLLDPVRRRFEEAIEAPEHRPHVPIVPAMLGNDAGAIGAAALALDDALREEG